MRDPHRYATRHATHGMVCSPDHLASEAGVTILRRGGSAADAAIAASAVLTVTAQHMCGLGGDLWALVHGADGQPSALNASGRAGSGADADRLRADGHTVMPFSGDVRSVPVPGCVDGWAALAERYGRLPLESVLEPALTLATEGFPASPLLAARIPSIADVAGADDFVAGPTVERGSLVRRPGVADALGAIGPHGRGAFYEGAFGDALIELGAGEYSRADLQRSQAEWVDPVVVRVWDHDVWTVPPNSQGYLTLGALWLAAHLDLPDDPDDGLWAHLLIEAARQAAADRVTTCHDGADGTELVHPDRLAARLGEIQPDRRSDVGDRSGVGDTIYLCAVDRDGAGVSLIQSNASGFGAGLTAPGTGIFLHNRGIGFSLEPGHPAEYGPGRRPPSTLSPTLITRGDGSLRAVVGTMGGDGQVQILLQILTRFLRHATSPGSAIARPRWLLAPPAGTGFDTWQHLDRAEVRLEADVPSAWASGLTERGHQVSLAGGLDSGFGHAHLIEATEQGLAGAADPRAIIGAACGY